MQLPTTTATALQSLLLLLPILPLTALAQQQRACNNAPSLCSTPYNSLTHLGAHDSPFVRDSSTSFSTSGNQFYNSTVQLEAGVRLLSAQVHSQDGQWRLCHSSCDLLDAGTLSDWLGEVKGFLDGNPDEVVTLLLVNSDGATAADLRGEYAAAGVEGYAYQPQGGAQGGGDWPTLGEMIGSGERLVSFVASLEDNTGAAYLLNEFDYVFENSFENSQFSDFSCAPDRPASVSGSASEAVSSGRMALMNHFLYQDQAFGIQSPDVGNLTTTNAPGNATGNLGLHLGRCTREYGVQPTFVLVDFFNVGPAIEAVDSANGVASPVGRRSVANRVLTEESESSAAAGANAAFQRWSLALVAVVLGYAVCR